MPTDAFPFISPGLLSDNPLQLRLTECQNAAVSIWKCPAYIFAIHLTDLNQPIGRVSLRISQSPTIVQYAGHIGFTIDPPHRGHHYVARAVRLLFSLAIQHNLTELWLTCDPANIASKKTILRLGAQYVETVTVPDDYPLPESSPREKCRYRIDLNQIPRR